MPAKHIHGHQMGSRPQTLVISVILFYSTANDGRPEPRVPSAGTSCDNMIVRSQHIEAKKDTVIKQ